LGNPALITNIHDYDRNKQVTSADQIIARNNPTSSIAGTALKFINIGAGGPFVPDAGDGDSGVAPAAAAVDVAPSGDSGVASALVAGSQSAAVAQSSNNSSSPIVEISKSQSLAVQAYLQAISPIDLTISEQTQLLASTDDLVDQELLELLASSAP
jgi:hypothetical protein